MGVVLPTLRKAQEILREHGHGAAAVLDDNAVELGFSWDRRAQHSDHTLEFKPDKAAQKIVCTSSVEGDDPESFTVDGLDQQAVERKAERFCYSVVRWGGGRKPSGGVARMPY